MMSERQRKSRDLTLVDRAYRGSGIEPLMDHPEVQKFFADYERRCVDAIAFAEPSEEGTRFDASMKLKAMRAFKSEMESAVATGRRAAEKLEGLENAG